MSLSFKDIYFGKNKIRNILINGKLNDKNEYKFLFEHIYIKYQRDFDKFVKTFLDNIFDIIFINPEILERICIDKPSIIIKNYNYLRENYIDTVANYEITIKNINRLKYLINIAYKRGIDHNIKIFPYINLDIVYNNLPSSEYIKKKKIEGDQIFLGTKGEFKNIIIDYLKSGTVNIDNSKIMNILTRPDNEYSIYYLNCFKNQSLIKEENVIRDFNKDPELIFYLARYQKKINISFKGIKKFDITKLKTFPNSYLEIINEMDYDEVNSNFKNPLSFDIEGEVDVVLNNDLELDLDEDLELDDLDDSFILPENFSNIDILYNTLVIIDLLKKNKVDYNQNINMFNYETKLDNGTLSVYDNLIDYTILKLLYEEGIYLYTALDYKLLIENLKNNLKFKYVDKKRFPILSLIINPESLNIFKNE